MTKKCTKCLVNKDYNSFSKRKASKDGLRTICKQCCASYASQQAESQKKPCLFCGNLCWGKKKRCQKCKQEHSLNNYETLTVGDKVYDKHKYAKYSYIRFWARKIAIEQLGFKKCCNCGYDKHIEIAHKKPVSSFPPETLIKDINTPDNLLPLCPNCHYEYDNNLLIL
jgi:hypothetical protein